jgi:predicted PurR-regulated permease PerM
MKRGALTSQHGQDRHRAAQHEHLRWTDSLSRAGERSRQLLLIIILVSVVVYALLRVTLVLIPLLLALILAAAISPFVNGLRRRGWPDGVATGTAFVLLIVGFGAVLLAVVFATRAEWDTLAAQASTGLDELYEALKDSPLPIDQSTIRSIQDSIGNLLTSDQAGNTALEGLFAVSGLVTGFILMAFILFFFLKDGGRMWAFCIQRLEGRQLAKTRLAGIRAIEVLGGYVRGTAIVAMVDAVLIGAALVVLRIPLALPLAVIVFIGAFIPVIGATATGILAAGVALMTNGPLAALVLIVVIFVVNQLEGNLLQPLIMGRTLSIHPMVVLLVLAAGAVLAGVIGAILAVPLTAVSWAIIKIWTDKRNPAVRAGEAPPTV